MRLRILSRVLPTIAIACLAAAWVCPAASAQERPRTVLTIHWGAEDFPGTAVLDAAIRESLLSEGGEPVNYYAEYLETEIFPAEKASLALRDYIRQKFEGRRIDVVVTIPTPALQFALRYRKELFPDVPIVSMAGARPDLVLNQRVAGVTGVVSDVAFAETLELALKVHPLVQRVFVVARAPKVYGYTERVRAALQPFANRVGLTYINEESVSGLLAAVKALPASSLILYTRYQPEDTENLYTDEIVRLLAQASAVPIYSINDVYLGTGVVGGMMRANRATGTRMGEMVRQILDGTPPESIPIESVRLAPTFDWRQLRRWGVDLSRLPPGSNVQFRTLTPWEAYRWYIIGTIVVVAAQLLLIAGLVTQRARLHRAKETIRAREATLRTSYQRIRHMAGRLINAQEAARAGIARDLHDDLCQKLVYVSMGVSSLKSSSAHIQDAQTQQALSELERDTNGVFDGIRRLSHDLHPATLRLLGLAPALKSYCSEVETRHDVEVSFTTGGDLGHLHPDVAVCFFRIAQESIRNGLVHGEARRFAVSLARSGQYVELSVTDDGRGFDLEAVRRDGSGLGLVSMEERARVVGADVHIVTGPGQGTTIRVRGPAEPPESTGLPDAGPRSEADTSERFPAVSSSS